MIVFAQCRRSCEFHFVALLLVVDMDSTGPQPWQPKLRVLCLHGSQQSAAVFEHRLERLVAKAASFAEFVFIDGPVELTQNASERVNARGWGLVSSESSDCDAVREVLKKAWAEQGPFDGVLGFSEGATAAVLYCQLCRAEEARADTNPSAGAGLRFAVIAGGPAPLAFAATEPCLKIPSLHIASASDSVVPIEDSVRLSRLFEGSEFLEHKGGHGFPQQTEDLKKVIQFFEKRQKDIYPSSAALSSVMDEDDPRVNSDQTDELEALSAMLTEDEFTRVAPAWPVRLSISIAGMEGTALRFSLPPGYPYEASCRCEFYAEMLHMLMYEQELMASVEEARVEGPSIFSMVQAAQQWAEEHAEALASRAPVNATGGGDDDEGAVDAPADAWWLKEDEVDETALQEAESRASELIQDSPGGGVSSWARECGSSSYGRPWEFVVGLVGKPSAGKSTFFNAATRPERADREASMAPHPFTTIDPNVGSGWFAAPCATLQFGHEDTVEPEHGRLVSGQRRYPLLIKDVAGLVPGAYCGRGRGNAFLNDLLEADSLIHVVDASGRSDREGVVQVHGRDTKDAAGSDPFDEIGWVRREIHLWIFCNVRAKFDSVRRRARMATVTTREMVLDRLFGLFTGYRASRQLVSHVYEAAGFSLQGVAEPGGVRDWREYDLHLLVACFLRARFPITVVMNKVDLAEAGGHFKRVQKELGQTCVAVSASAEWWLWDQQRQGHLTYKEGGGAENVSLSPDAPAAVKDRWEKVRTQVLEPYGSTGVLPALSAAVLRRRPVFVCPVIDFASCEGLPRAKGAKATFGTMVMLRPLSTVEEAYAALQREQMLRGDFVRAELLEAAKTAGGSCTTRVVKRDQHLRAANAPADQVVVVRILTNKK